MLIKWIRADNNSLIKAHGVVLKALACFNAFGKKNKRFSDNSKFIEKGINTLISFRRIF